MAKRRTRETAERRPRRRLGVFSLAALAVLAAAGWIAPAVLVHTSLRDRPLEAVFAGIDGRVTTAAATWNWFRGIEFRDLTLSDSAGRPAVFVSSLVIEKGIVGLVLDPRDLGTVRLSGVEAVIAVRPGGSSLEDILAPWLARSTASGVACDLELVAGTVDLVTAGRNDAWRLSDLIAAGTLVADGSLSGWTVAGRLGHVGDPGSGHEAGLGTAPGGAAGRPAGSGSSLPLRLDRTTIPAAAAAVLARDGGWSISSPTSGPGSPRPLTVTAHRLPLGLSSILATRFELPRLVDGLADIRLDMTLGPAGRDLGGRVIVDDLAVCRVDTLVEEFGINHCELPFDLVISPAGLVTVRELRATSPVVRAEVSGRLPLPSRDLWDWLDACSLHDCGLAAEVDLAAAAESLPGGLTVRPDVRITGGSLHLGAVARGDGEDRVLEVRVDSRDLAAVRTVEERESTEPTGLVPIGVKASSDRPLRWSEPFTAWLKGRRGPAIGNGLRIEEARITSPAAEFSATGTPAALQMQWSVDLGNLCGELAEVIDFAGLTVAGRSRGRLDVERVDGGLTAVRVAASITEFELAAPDRPAWKDDTIAFDAEAIGSFGLERLAIESARGMLTAAGDSVEATLRGGMVIEPSLVGAAGAGAKPAISPSPGANEVSADCSVSGDLAQWQRRLGAVIPGLVGGGLELGGRIEAAAAVASDAATADVWRITRAGGEIEKFAARLGDRQASEPRVVLTAAGLVRPLTGGIEISSAELLSSSLSLRTGGLSWQARTVGPEAGDLLSLCLGRLRGRVQWQVDLARVEPWLVAVPVAWQWPITGRAWGTLDAAETQTGINLLLEMTGSQVVIAERPPGDRGDQQQRPVWNEPQATLALEITRPFVRSAGGSISLGERLIIERLSIESSTVAVTARGSIDDLARRRQTTLEGTFSHDWAQVSRLLTPWTAGRIMIAGSGGRPFTFRGSLAGNRTDVVTTGSSLPTSSPGSLPLPEAWLEATRGGAGHSPEATVRVPARPASSTRGLIESLRGVSFDTSAAWTAADLDGFPLAAGELAIRLVEGQLALGPFDLAASGGRIRGAPWIRLAPFPGEIIVPPGRIVERVALTGGVSNRLISLVSPVLAGSTYASGVVSIDTAGMRLPLGDLFAGEAAGQVVFEQLEVRPSGAMQPLVNLLAKLQAVIDPRVTLGEQAVLLRVRPEPVRLRLAERRLWHEGLMMDAGQMVVRSQGSVGADGSLAAVVEVALRGDLVGQTPVIAQLMRTPITIPLKGTVARPQFDAGALDVALRRILENTARAVIDDGLGRGLEALFGFPAAASGPASPTGGPPLTLPR